MNDGEKLYEVERALDGEKQVRFCKDCIHYRKDMLEYCAASPPYTKDRASNGYYVSGNVNSLITCQMMRTREDICGGEGKLFVLKEPKLSWFKKLFK